VHEALGKRTVGRKQQQPAGVEVEPADRDPAAATQPWQGVEDAWPPLRIVARNDFPFRLVVEENTGQARGEMQIDESATELDPVPRGNPLTESGRFTVDLNAPSNDPALDLTPRTETGVSERLV